MSDPMLGASRAIGEALRLIDEFQAKRAKPSHLDLLSAVWYYTGRDAKDSMPVPLREAVYAALPPTGAEPWGQP